MALFGAVTYIPLYLQVVKGASPTAVGAAAAAADGRAAHRVDRQRAADHALRPLQDLPDRRHRADGRRAAAALAPRSGTTTPARRPLHGRARARPRLHRCRCSSSRSRTRSTTATSASRPRPPRSSARWAARSASRSSARSSRTSSPPNLAEPAAARCRRALPGPLGPSQIDQLAAGDPRPLHRRLGRSAPPRLPDRGRDRGARVRAHVVPPGAAAPRDGRRPGPRRQLRRTPKATSLDELETRLSTLARRRTATASTSTSPTPLGSTSHPPKPGSSCAATNTTHSPPTKSRPPGTSQTRRSCRSSSASRPITWSNACQPHQINRFASQTLDIRPPTRWKKHAASNSKLSSTTGNPNNTQRSSNSSKPSANPFAPTRPPANPHPPRHEIARIPLAVAAPDPRMPTRRLPRAGAAA